MESIKDSRELLSSKTSVKNFPKIVFSQDATKTKTTTTLKVKSTQAMQNDVNKATAGTQTDNSKPETNEHCVNQSTTTMSVRRNTRRVNHSNVSQEEYAPNEEASTMTNTRLEASHHMITERIVATINQATLTESEEDTPPFRQKLQKVLGVKFIAAATRKDRTLRPLITFVKKRDWESIKSSYGQYWYKVRNRLHVREKCLLIDERIVVPTQLRQTVLESLHLTHP